MDNKKRNYAVNTGLVLVSAGFLFVFAELALRVGVPLFRPRFTMVDPVVGWSHNPSTTNVEEMEGHRYRLSYGGQGYRVHEHAYDKPGGGQRVVVLGDSFVDGSEVGDNETFTWLLQEGLPGIEVINLGVYGYSTGQELITLEQRGLRYDPDLVLLVTMTNDYHDNVLNISSFGPAPRYVLTDNSIALEGTDHDSAMTVFRQTNLPAPAMRYLHEHSLLYYFLNHYIYHPLIAGRIASIVEEQRNTLSDDEKLELYLRIVSRMKALCDAQGVAFRVLFVYPESVVEKKSHSPSGRVVEALQSRGIDVFDFHGSLHTRQMDDGPSLYYEHDFHWNKVGHQYVAEVLMRQLPAWLSGESTEGGLAVDSATGLSPESRTRADGSQSTENELGGF